MAHRMIDRLWRPVCAVLFGVTLAALGVAVLVLASIVRDSGENVDRLRQQVRALGGNPDAPTVVVNVTMPPQPGGTQPASPTRREVRPTPTTTPSPTPPPARTPTRSPSASPTHSPSPSCTPLPIVGCL